VEHAERPAAELGLPHVLRAFTGAQQVNADPSSWEPEWLPVLVCLRAVPGEPPAVIVVNEDHALIFNRIL
jgi:hypothetical protein